MSSGQTLITIIAFTLLMSILTNFYRLLSVGGVTVSQTEADIAQQALATSYSEIAQALPFDEHSIDSFITTSSISYLTDAGNLGRENPPPSGEPTEASLTTFDDFDDFNGYEFDDSSLVASIGIYHAKFKVQYVLATDISTATTTKTLVKRLDITIWRKIPPSADTLRTSTVLGYFHFD